MSARMLLCADHFEECGGDLFRAVCDMDLEGIVAELKNGLYTPDQTSWVKIKNLGYSQMEGRRELFERRTVAI
jgi:ATP-dependent DNA ligase